MSEFEEAKNHWFTIMREQLDEIKKELKDIREEQRRQYGSYVTIVRFDELRATVEHNQNELRDMQFFRAKLIGMYVAATAISGIIMFVISEILHKK